MTRRRARLALMVYALLLVASWVTQSVRFQPTPPTGKSLTLDDGVRIVYDEAGPVEGPVVVLLHGSPGQRGDFEHLMHELAGRYRVIAPDLPGFGQSTASLPDYGIDAQAQRVLTMMDKLAVERAHVLGFSLGSGVALHMEHQAPDRVASISFFGGIGIQEGEGSGDYYFEHLKYRLGYAALVWAVDLVPHFGLLGPRDFRHGFLRSFMDSDQRPLRGLLRAVSARGKPMLILHGRNDFLVPAWVAYEHHTLVESSELVMFEPQPGTRGGHFMLFSQEGSERVAREMLSFLDRVEQGEAATRRTTDLSAGYVESNGPLKLNLRRGASPWRAMAVIVTATFFLEDLACVTVALLVKAGELDIFVGALGCVIGIYLGDTLLWLVGRFGLGRLERYRWFRKRLPMTTLEHFGHWFDRRGWVAVIASRFIPGTRLPLYLTVGMKGKKPLRFFLWTFIAVLIWVPFVLGAVALLGDWIARPIVAVFGKSWLALIVMSLLMLLTLHLVERLITPIGRAQLKAGIRRLWCYEYWPAWVFYMPLWPYIIGLGLRYRGLTVWTLVNEGIDHGGIVGESKSAILAHLPPEWVVPWARLDKGQSLDELMARHGWSFPLVFKPDAGQRGFGVKLIRDAQAAQRYLDDARGPLLVQTYHPGPHEVGVFYIRPPDAAQGFIYAITDKRFPLLTGDGRHDLEHLIWLHPRYRMQAKVFLKRHAEKLDDVPAAGERVPLAMAGNHCQGTMFLDGAGLITPALTQRIDAIARSFPGFHFGRFDLRFADRDALMRGEGFAILELNGATSEATNLYDPHKGLFFAYRVLFGQWRWAYRIGAMVRKRTGKKPMSYVAFFALLRAFYRGRQGDAVSD